MMTDGERLVWAATYAMYLDTSCPEGPASAVYAAHEAVEAMRAVARGMHRLRPQAWADDHARKMLDEMLDAREIVSFPTATDPGELVGAGAQMVDGGGESSCNHLYHRKTGECVCCYCDARRARGEHPNQKEG
jgi:hypothetical protein